MKTYANDVQLTSTKRLKFTEKIILRTAEEGDWLKERVPFMKLEEERIQEIKERGFNAIYTARKYFEGFEGGFEKKCLSRVMFFNLKSYETNLAVLQANVLQVHLLLGFCMDLEWNLSFVQRKNRWISLMKRYEEKLEIFRETVDGIVELISKYEKDTGNYQPDDFGVWTWISLASLKSMMNELLKLSEKCQMVVLTF